ncbi:UNVERIFIED_CONTAM: glycosyltransferase involved in cell wall biosynthesis [Acetivibrio alkalicellulosi]
MRVLIIMTTTMEISGITMSVMNYYRYMDKNDMSIDFIAPNVVPKRIRDEIELNNGKIFELLMRRRNPIKYFNTMRKIISEGKYDIVHAHGNSCTLALEMLAARLEAVKVRIAHSRNTTCVHRLIHKLLRPIFDTSYTDGFACGVEAGKWLFRRNKFTVIKNGNDIDKFAFNQKTRQEYREKYKLNGKKVIGHVGYFNYQKNHEFLIEVFNDLVKINPEYVLLLVGDGSLKEDIKSKVKKLGLENQVIFIGKSLEVERLVQAMDIMVLPSRYEGLPNVVVEWQIACLPCLVSDKVTKEVKLTDLVEFMPLEAGSKEWANKINKIKLIDRNLIKDSIVKQITRAGYNVKENAKELKKLYIELTN